MLKGPPNSASPGDGGHSAAATDQDASAASSATSLPGPDTGVALLYLSSAGSLIIGTGAQFVAFLVLARYLGIHQFGLLTTIVAATNLAVPFCGLGSHEGIVRRLSRDPRDYSKMLGHALILIATTGTILSVVLAAILNCFVTISPNAGANLTSIAIIVVSNVVLHRFILLAEDIFISRWQMNKAN